jgi:uncharacterized protein YbaP (TraB family)
MWIDSRLQAIGFPEEGYRLLEHSYLAATLLSDACEDFSFGWLPIQDARIAMLAKLAGVPLLGLEHFDAILNRLRDDPTNQIAMSIIASYGAYLDPDIGKADLALTLKLYLEGRIGVLETMDRDSITRRIGERSGLEMYQTMDNYMIVERNRNFFDSALPQTESGGAFIAIGSFHLPGETGLPAMFAAQGYNVERVWVAGEVH